MFDISKLRFKRAMLSTINPRSHKTEPEKIETKNTLINLNEEIGDVVKQKLLVAFCSKTKAFILEPVANIGFFSAATRLKDMNENEFYEANQKLARHSSDVNSRKDLLVKYLLVIDAVTEHDKSVSIVIEAFRESSLKEISNDEFWVDIQSNLFLSSEQKDFKVGIVVEREYVEKEGLGSKHGCWMFDSKFAVDGKYSKEFYVDFLGFSIENCAEIQTKRFYNYTEHFILENFNDSKRIARLICALKDEITNDDGLLRPYDFAKSYFDSESLEDQYKIEVAGQLPSSIKKSNMLIQSKLWNTKINFPNNVFLQGKKGFLETNTKVIDSQEKMDELDCNDPSYTIIKIAGKAYQDKVDRQTAMGFDAVSKGARK